MTDRHGVTLKEGDRVLYYGPGGLSEQDAVAATVVEALGDDRYLVQLERSGAGESPGLTALLDQMDAGQADAGGSPVDSTEPFDVPGEQLALRDPSDRDEQGPDRAS